MVRQGFHSIKVPSVAGVPFVCFVGTNDRNVAIEFFASKGRRDLCRIAGRWPIVVNEASSARLLGAFGVAFFYHVVRLSPDNLEDASRAFHGVDDVCRGLLVSFPRRVVQALQIGDVLVDLRDPLACLLTLLSFYHVVVERLRPKEGTYRRPARYFRVDRPLISSIPHEARLRLRVLLRLTFARVLRGKLHCFVAWIGPLYSIIRQLVLFLVDNVCARRAGEGGDWWGGSRFRGRSFWVTIFSVSILHFGTSEWWWST